VFVSINASITISPSLPQLAPSIQIHGIWYGNVTRYERLLSKRTIDAKRKSLYTPDSGIPKFAVCNSIVYCDSGFRIDTRSFDYWRRKSQQQITFVQRWRRCPDLKQRQPPLDSLSALPRHPSRASTFAPLSNNSYIISVRPSRETAWSASPWFPLLALILALHCQTYLSDEILLSLLRYLVLSSTYHSSHPYVHN
jgi:hypothetical protein